MCFCFLICKTGANISTCFLGLLSRVSELLHGKHKDLCQVCGKHSQNIGFLLFCAMVTLIPRMISRAGQTGGRDLLLWHCSFWSHPKSSPCTLFRFSDFEAHGVLPSYLVGWDLLRDEYKIYFQESHCSMTASCRASGLDPVSNCNAGECYSLRNRIAIQVQTP